MHQRPHQLARFGLIGLILLTLSLTPTPLTQAETPLTNATALSKVDPWVLAHTTNGQTAEFMVVLQAQADVSAAYQLPTKQARGQYVYQTLWNLAQRTQTPITTWLKSQKVAYRAYYLVNLLWVKGDQNIVLALAARPEVARIDPNPRFSLNLPRDEAMVSQPTEIPNAIEPGLTYVGAPTVWGMGYTGQGIVIGGQDTGYRWTHNSLKNKYRGWNGTTADHNYNWHDSIHVNPGTCGADATEPCDDFGHGTHTMGTMVGDDGGTNQIGMAPGAKWIGCRNMDTNGNGTLATYLECFEFFLAPYPVGGTPAQGNPAMAPDVTNNSWGCPASEGCNSNNWATMQAAIAAHRAAGIMTVASAGNEGSACSTVSNPPGMFDESYSVGAFSSSTGTIASFSSRGPVTADGSNRPKPDISAPGVSVRSATISGDATYGASNGTSMAGPHVAGAVALLWSARPFLANQITQTEQILNDSAVHVSVTNTCSSNGWPNNVYGYGRLNVLNAVTMTAGLANNFGVALSANLPQTQLGAPAQTLTYTLALSNTGDITDTYNLQISSPFTASVQPSPASNTPPTSTRTLTVLVTIPANAMANTVATTAITATSQTSATARATTWVTTSVKAMYTALVTPTMLTQTVWGNMPTTYTLWLTNTGNATDSYTLTVLSMLFTATPTNTVLGPVNPGQSISFTITIVAPLFTVDFDRAKVTVISQGAQTMVGDTILNTYAEGSYNFLPFITKPLGALFVYPR